jgi:hypothetical protein
MLYSFDSPTLTGVLFAAGFVVIFLIERARQRWPGFSALFAPAAVVAAALAGLTLVRLYCAARYYLRLPHAPGVVAATQIIALLLTVWMLGWLPWTSETMLECINDIARAWRTAW